MQLCFLHNVYVPDSDGKLVVAHPDADAVPEMNIYNQGNTLIETPSGVKITTLLSSTGHYTYILNWLLYQNDSWYYWLADWEYNSRAGRTQRQYYKWGFAGTSEGIVSDGYNLNLNKALKNVYEASPTLVSLLGHAPANVKTNKIHRASVFKKTDNMPYFPFMTSEILWQGGVDELDQNITSIRKNILEVKFYHPSDQVLLFKLIDHWLLYMLESNSFNGVRIKTTDNIFWSFNNLGYDQTITGPDSIQPWNDELKTYVIGARIEFIAGLHTD